MYNRIVKRLVLRAVFVAIPFMILACDYGMSIRQVNSPDHVSQESSTKDSQIVVTVEPAERLIGETWYSTGVRLTNDSREPVLVSNIDIFAQNKIYQNEPTQFTTYPLRINPSGTERVGVYFRLDDDVENTFRNAADLRVYYRIGNEQRIAHARIVGGGIGSK
jgi:hypothetical protein